MAFISTPMFELLKSPKFYTIFFFIFFCRTYKYMYSRFCTYQNDDVRDTILYKAIFNLIIYEMYFFS